MTDSIIDEGTTKTSTSLINTSRRPMVIETEIRTDSITKRRQGSASLSRSVYDILENTKSPTDGLPPTTYTYAHSVSYMPVTQNGTYDVPVMARRDLHGDSRVYGSSNYSSHSTLFASPQRFVNNVRSQIVSGYSALRDRLTHHDDEHQGSSIHQSPSNRYSRTTTTTTNTANSSSSDLRRRTPIHSTPRETDYKDQFDQSTSKKFSQRDEDADGHNDEEENIFVRFFKRILRIPLDIFKFFFKKFFSLPWWLLIPLLLFFGVYTFPTLLCRPFEHYPESEIYQQCQRFQGFTHNFTNNTVNYVYHHTVERGFGNLRQFYDSLIEWKRSIFDWIDSFYYNTKKSFRRWFWSVQEPVKEVVEKAKTSAEEYCTGGIEKMNALIDEVKREREKFLGNRHALKPEQEAELRTLLRNVIDEYTADETGQADYALEANGGKIVDTRCTEYTDEPRQNVVKFLGIPIVHMSKHPDIMIKAGRLPGQCFPFKGDQGSVIIRLAVPIRPTEFVLEHLSKSISIVGHINSAPNNFTVYALKDKHDKEGRVLGRYFYDAENGPSLQRFKPQIQHVPIVEFIEVRVTSNWGNPNYTCLYRFRVHGDLKSIHSSHLSPAA